MKKTFNYKQYLTGYILYGCIVGLLLIYDSGLKEGFGLKHASTFE